MWWLDMIVSSAKALRRVLVGPGTLLSGVCIRRLAKVGPDVQEPRTWPALCARRLVADKATSRRRAMSKWMSIGFDPDHMDPGSTPGAQAAIDGLDQVTSSEAGAGDRL